MALFNATLLTIANIKKQLKYLLRNKWIKKLVCVWGGGQGVMEYYSAIKKGIIATCGNTDGP